MSKYIIDTDKYYLHEFDGALIVMMHEGKPVSVYESKDNLEELNSDYINENFGELQDEAYKQGYADAERIWRAPSSDNEFYQKGLEDAWDAARKIAVNMDVHERARVFFQDAEAVTHEEPFKSYTAQEAIDKIKAYEDKRSDRIEVGDIVDVYGNLGVVTYMYELKACVMMVEDGSSGNWNLNELKKTGKHYDIASILEAMRTHD